MDKKYLTIKSVAQILGVTPLTLRNWDKAGKLIARRNPMNNYRMYRREDIEDLVGQIEYSSVPEGRKPPKPKKRKLEIRSLE
ncbi:hypothetical protein COB55_02525 [Candidatus Wolfebacteria bacterium]|nr:MAG: hypothetical protein COB55_02525 [Candidatus Wolfebacteria bacterium]